MENNIIFSVLQWNTLCSNFATPESFPYVQQNCLQWDKRKTLIKDYLLKEKSDFICLEEIDNFDDYKKDIIQPLQKYETIFAKKNNGVMGICIGYDYTKFKAIDNTVLQLNKNENEKSSQIALIANFESIQNNKKICLIVTHLKAKKEFEDTRVFQIKHIVDYIETNKIIENKINVILVGDFNTEPTEKSISTLLNSKIGFKNSFEFENKEKENFITFTTMKRRDTMYKRIIDYIWYAGSNIQHLSSVIANPKYNDEVGFPNEFFPSDHLFIKSQFELNH